MDLQKLKHTAVVMLTKDCTYYITSLAVLACFTFNQLIEAWEASCDAVCLLGTLTGAKGQVPGKREVWPSVQAVILFVMYIGASPSIKDQGVRPCQRLWFARVTKLRGCLMYA